MRAAAVLAVFGALLLVVGAGLAWIPAGFLVAGAEALAGAYVIAYLEARRADD